MLGAAEVQVRSFSAFPCAPLHRIIAICNWEKIKKYFALSFNAFQALSSYYDRLVHTRLL